jgi:hypothetical protein
MDAVEKITVSCLCLELNLSSLAVKLMSLTKMELTETESQDVD